MVEILGLIIENLIGAIIALSLLYILKITYLKFFSKKKEVKKTYSSKIDFHGDFFVFSMNLSMTTLAFFYYIKSILIVIEPFKLLTTDIKIQVVVLFIFLGSIPLFLLYFLYCEIREQFY